jgi:hypothetical protein
LLGLCSLLLLLELSRALAFSPLLLASGGMSCSSQLLAFSDAGLPAKTTSMVAVAPAGTRVTSRGCNKLLLLLLLSTAPAALLLLLASCSCCSTDRN